MAAPAESWPRRDVADHHQELCAGCGVELGHGEVIRLACGAGYHPICHDPPPRPPAGEAEAFWESCLPVETDSGAMGYLRVRGLLRAALELDMVRLLDAGRLDRALGGRPAWARYGGRDWAETGHQLIVPIYDHAGRLALVRGWRWEPDDSPKRLAAAGCSVRGLVMAGGRGRELLRGELPDWVYPARVLVTEGEPDTLAATTKWPDCCVLGVVAGCWCPELAGRVPSGAQVVIRTDSDEAGERYAVQIAETLRGRCDIERAYSE